MKMYINPEIELISVMTKDVISNSYVIATGSDKCVNAANNNWTAIPGLKNDGNLDDGSGLVD